MIKSAILILALLPLAACASTTAPSPQAAAPMASGSAQDMNCEQLAAAERNAASDLAWIRRQQQQTFGGDSTSNVTMSMPIGGSGGSGGGPQFGRVQSQQADLRQAMTAKGCT